VKADVPNRNRLAWWLLWLSLICCLLEGAARKWFVGDTTVPGRIAYLSKDMVLATFVLLGAGCANTFTTIAQPYLRVGIGMLAIGAVGSFLFGFEPVGGVLTIRTFFVLPLAAWAAGRQLPADSMQRFARWVAILSLPMAVLCVRQFYSPSDSYINRYSIEEEKVAVALSGVSDRVRATGTFSYISGLSEFAPVAVWAGIVTFNLARTRRERWVGYAAVAAGACCSFVTVSRFAALVSVGLLVIWIMAGGQLGSKARAAITIGIAGLAVITLTKQWESAAEIATTVYRRHEEVTKQSDRLSTTHDSFTHRLWYQFIHPWDAIAIAPLGDGLGAQQGKSMADVRTGRQGILFESPWGRTIMELGVAGLIGFVATLGVVLGPLRADFRIHPQGVERSVLAVTGALLFVKSMIGFQFNHVGSYFFWAIAATILARGSVASAVRPRRAENVQCLPRFRQQIAKQQISRELRQLDGSSQSP
jgi:hypothetical protein